MNNITPSNSPFLNNLEALLDIATAELVDRFNEPFETFDLGTLEEVQGSNGWAGQPNSSDLFIKNASMSTPPILEGDDIVPYLDLGAPLIFNGSVASATVTSNASAYLNDPLVYATTQSPPSLDFTNPCASTSNIDTQRDAGNVDGSQEQQSAISPQEDNEDAVDDAPSPGTSTGASASQPGCGLKTSTRFRKTLRSTKGVNLPGGYTAYYGAFDWAKVANRPFLETRIGLLQFVDYDKSLVGLFNYTFTPEGKLRCDADCNMTASGWTVIPKGCSQEYSTEAAYLVHLKSAHIFDFSLGDRNLRTWLARQLKIVKQQQQEEQLSVQRHLKSNI